MQKGTVNFYNEERGYGSIAADIGCEVDMHSAGIIPTLRDYEFKEGVRVQFEMLQDDDDIRPRAVVLALENTDSGGSCYADKEVVSTSISR